MLRVRVIYHRPRLRRMIQTEALIIVGIGRKANSIIAFLRKIFHSVPIKIIQCKTGIKSIVNIFIGSLHMQTEIECVQN